MGYYYRLFDKQKGNYLCTGYNSTSKNELIEAYISYISIDLEKEELNEFNHMKLGDKLKFIESCEFIVEKSNKKFEHID